MCKEDIEMRYQPKGRTGVMPLPDQLRYLANAKTTIAWESQARMLMIWAADTIDAANTALRDNAQG